MKGLMRVLGGAIVAMALAAPAHAAPINVAAGATVTTTGVVGVMTCCWPVGPLAPLSSITDGVFLPEESIWQTDTVWWDERNAASTDNVIEIDLGGLFDITRLTIQADNNESYLVSYRDAGGFWIALPFAGPLGPFGMITRDSGPVSFQASGFRIDAAGGDAFYSVSEFQAFAAPEPGVLALLGLGVAGAIRRRLRG
jgi:hypothetical protein